MNEWMKILNLIVNQYWQVICRTILDFSGSNQVHNCFTSIDMIKGATWKGTSQCCLDYRISIFVPIKGDFNNMGEVIK